MTHFLQVLVTTLLKPIPNVPAALALWNLTASGTEKQICKGNCKGSVQQIHKNIIKSRVFFLS